MIVHALKYRNMHPRLRDAVAMSVAWAVPALILNLAWEVAQLPFYAIPSAQSTAQVALAIAHCTAGDVAIAVVSFLIAVIALGDANWPVSHPWRGGAIAIMAGVSYTAVTEWYSVYQAGYWAYTSNMPLIFGIGLSPLLQWVVIPAAVILVVRNLGATAQAVYSSRNS